LGCGFCDSGHFSRAFRKRFKMTPREFRLTEAQEHATP
jgi:AraC-like DNA-binding protein